MTEKISPHQHIVELKELMNLLLERAALEAYRGNLKEAERYLLGAERAIWEIIEIVRESMD
ncbi:MAG: hypothetical protein NZ902_00670 [Acidilobaceae archaeon]|nr:hypothetical protein [Acidilobaceae archaeon]MDW7973771.1 hypothetical protein [Sulfolobales archaeon]